MISSFLLIKIISLMNVFDDNPASLQPAPSYNGPELAPCQGILAFDASTRPFISYGQETGIYFIIASYPILTSIAINIASYVIL